jgi:methyl acetate hydrolase
MSNTFRESADAVLKRAVAAESPVPGVVAMVTDRTGNVYEGAAGNRQAGGETPMTTEDVFALSSTTKAVTGDIVIPEGAGLCQGGVRAGVFVVLGLCASSAG